MQDFLQKDIGSDINLFVWYITIHHGEIYMTKGQWIILWLIMVMLWTVWVINKFLKKNFGTRFIQTMDIYPDTWDVLYKQ